MADFCKDCSIELFGEDFNDFAGLCKENEMIYVLCEGCGWVYVNHFGARIPDELVE